MFWASCGSGKEPGSGNRLRTGPGLDGFRQVSGAVPKVLGGRSSEVAGSGGSESCLVPGFDGSVPEVGKDLCGFEGFGGSGFRWVPTGSEVLEIPLARFGKLPRFPKFHWFRLSRAQIKCLICCFETSSITQYLKALILFCRCSFCS